MGTLEYITDKFCGGSKQNKRRTQFQTVELKVRMDCEGCEQKVRKSVSSIAGVQTVDINRKMQKVTLSGYIEPKKVIRKVKGTGKHTELWPYVPYNAESQPMVSATYDKKAPAGYVRRVEQDSLPNPSRQGDQYTNAFSEENPNACSLM